MTHAGLVLEGGGMRGVYTAGVLDLLLDRKLMFGEIYGVSAGVCHACSYVSRQRGRAMKTVSDYARDRRYASVHSLVTTGDFFGVQMVYDEIPNKLLPYDYDAFENSGVHLYAVLTDCRTGKPEYRLVEELRRDMDLIRASSSLPLLSRMVEVDGGKYLDGGISDSIPLARSIEAGNMKNLVILTRHRGYEKEPSGMMNLMKARYMRYPSLVESIRNRHHKYHAALTLVYNEEQAGRAFVIQPKAAVKIGRLEKDVDKLEALYQQGYDDARERMTELREFLRDCRED